jgi:uncharacterized membrane protein
MLYFNLLFGVVMKKFTRLFYDNIGITEFGIVALAVFVLVSLFGLAFVSIDKINEYQCNNFHEVTGREVIYKHFDACYVKSYGKFIRYDRNFKD